MIREHISVENLKTKKGVEVKPDEELTCPPDQDFLYDAASYFTDFNGLRPYGQGPVSRSERAKEILDKYEPLNAKLKPGGIFIAIRHEQDTEKYLDQAEIKSAGFRTVVEYREPTDRRFVVTVLRKVDLPKKIGIDLTASDPDEEDGKKENEGPALEDLERLEKRTLNSVLRPRAAGDTKRESI